MLSSSKQYNKANKRLTENKIRARKRQTFYFSHFLLCLVVLWYPGVWKVRLVAGPSPSAAMARTSSV